MTYLTTRPTARDGGAPLTAAVVAAPGYLPQNPRRLLLTLDGDSAQAPGYVRGGLQLVLGVGARVHVERVGRQLLVVGAV